MESQEKFEIYWPLERKYWHDFEPFGKNHRSLCLKRQVSKSKFRSQKWESKRKSNLFKDLFKNEPTNIKGIWNLPYHMKKRNKKHQNARQWSHNKWTSFCHRQGNLLRGKANSVQEACANCFEVHISKFEIFQTTWKIKQKTSKC